MKLSKSNATRTSLAVRLDSTAQSTKSAYNSSKDHSSTYHSSLLQVLAAFVALLGAWAIGCILCYTSPAIPSMKRAYTADGWTDADPNSTLTTQGDFEPPFLSRDDHDSETWITSIINLGALAGSIAGGPLNCRMGHRRFLLLVGLACAVGWLVIAFASEIWLVLLGRAITGFCGGLICVSVPVYIVDIATIGSRGFLGCSFQGQCPLLLCAFTF
jgi:facilitated trehalose transporter